jgi:hypothetical protein
VLQNQGAQERLVPATNAPSPDAPGGGHISQGGTVVETALGEPLDEDPVDEGVPAAPEAELRAGPAGAPAAVAPPVTVTVPVVLAPPVTVTVPVVVAPPVVVALPIVVAAPVVVTVPVVVADEVVVGVVGLAVPGNLSAP